ncbi:hypothetical protein Anas_07215 [Armadillidium nasatum]|uniref:Uncharacterized protein n=1 Tax=Armadillidium nasatum TaxID=96803 RepID=A0A5N5SX48_9CRUS|nr:hypothetical protein Anas_07215 [Armadillidium nasatum]
MVPVFIALIVLEEFYLFVRKGKHIRINDGVISIAHGMIMDVIRKSQWIKDAENGFQNTIKHR